jgi:hypothetical protein
MLAHWKFSWSQIVSLASVFRCSTQTVITPSAGLRARLADKSGDQQPERQRERDRVTIVARRATRDGKPVLVLRSHRCSFLLALWQADRHILCRAWPIEIGAASHARPTPLARRCASRILPL